MTIPEGKDECVFLREIDHYQLHALRSQRQKEDQAISVVHVYVSEVYFSVNASISAAASTEEGL